MKKFKSILFAIIMALVVLVSCSKDIMSDGENAAEGNITLTVLTRAQGAGTTEMTVASPINIYVFDATGKCVGLKSVDSESDVADFKLAEGVYFVNAIAGADVLSLKHIPVYCNFHDLLLFKRFMKKRNPGDCAL